MISGKKFERVIVASCLFIAGLAIVPSATIIVGSILVSVAVLYKCISHLNREGLFSL